MGACPYGQGKGTCTNMSITGRLENVSKLNKKGTRMSNDSIAESIPACLEIKKY